MQSNTRNMEYDVKLFVKNKRKGLSSMKETWFWDRIRQVHIDFHMPEFPREAIKNFNAVEFVAELKRAKVNMATVFTKCHFGNSFYNTSIGHKHSGLEGDFFGEVLDEAHKNDIKVLAYYSLGADEYAVKKNPDWYQVDEEGRIRDGNGTVWHRPCMNAPYREELVIPQIKEITQKYDIDGVFIDIPYIEHHMCFCRYCKKKFFEEYNMELTPSLLEKNRDTVIEFGRNSAIRCLVEIQKSVKGIKPDIPILVNCAWKMGEPEGVNNTSDVGVWESQPAAGSYLYHSVKSRYVRSLDVPVQIITVRFTEGWGLMSCKTAEQLKYEAAVIMANGGIVNIGDQVMPDGRLQSGVYDILGEVFSFVEEREKFAIRSKSIPHLALIANYTSNRYWDNGDFATLGASKMLIEGHQQFDIFYNNDFKDLSRYNVAVLPETVRLNEASMNKIGDFVKNGGLLLTSGKAILPEGKQDLKLAEILGINYLEFAPYRFAYMTQNKDLWKGTANIPQLLDGAFIKVIPTTAQILSSIQWPCGESVPPRAFRHSMPPPGDVSDFPAISVNRYGKGYAIYIAAPIFTSYWNNNHFWLKHIVNNCINSYDGKKPYYIDGLPGLEVTMTEKEGKRYLHLINFQNVHSGNRATSLYDPIEEINPIHDVRIKIRTDKVEKMLLQPEGMELDFLYSGNIAEVCVPKVHIYSIIEIL